MAIEEINVNGIVDDSAEELPDRPREAGYTAATLKAALVSPSRKLVAEVNRVIAGIETELAAFETELETKKAEIIAGIESGDISVARAETAGHADSASQADSAASAVWAERAQRGDATPATSDNSDKVATTAYIHNMFPTETGAVYLTDIGSFSVLKRQMGIVAGKLELITPIVINMNADPPGGITGNGWEWFRIIGSISNPKFRPEVISPCGVHCDVEVQSSNASTTSSVIVSCLVIPNGQIELAVSVATQSINNINVVIRVYALYFGYEAAE
jgi:hypothetical protein